MGTSRAKRARAGIVYNTPARPRMGVVSRRNRQATNPRGSEVSKRYGSGPAAVDHLSLDVGQGEVCVLVGPSGCGKTTTMKMINRLIEPTSGRIFLDGDDVTHTDPITLRRRMGYVIQNVGLFPHQTIATTVATLPRFLG